MHPRASRCHVEPAQVRSKFASSWLQDGRKLASSWLQDAPPATRSPALLARGSKALPRNLQEPPGCSQPASKHQVCKHRCLWTITITVTIAITITITISIDAAVAVAVAIDIDIALTATVVGMIVFIIILNPVTITSAGTSAIRGTTELQFPIVLISLLWPAMQSFEKSIAPNEKAAKLLG